MPGPWYYQPKSHQTCFQGLHGPLHLIHSLGLHSPRPRDSCLQEQWGWRLSMCTGVSIHMHLRHCWYRMVGGWEEKGGRLPAGGGRGAQRFGASPAEGIHFSAHLELSHSACQSGNFGPGIFYCDLTMLWILTSIPWPWSRACTLQSRWVTRGHVCPLDHYPLSCVGTAASLVLLLPPLVYQIHCACLMANNFSTLWERILFVFLKFRWKQT